MSKLISQIRKKVTTFPTFLDFVIACPYGMDELREKNRKRDLVMWRQIGMIIHYNESNNQKLTGHHFERDHSTVIYAIEAFNDCLYGFGSREMARTFHAIKPSDTITNNKEAISSYQLQEMYNKMVRI